MKFYADNLTTFTGPQRVARAEELVGELPIGAAEHLGDGVVKFRRTVETTGWDLAVNVPPKRKVPVPIFALLWLFVFIGAAHAGGLGEPSTSLGGAWAAFLPLAEMSGGEWIISAAAGMAAITTILIFIRRESRLREPKEDHTVSGGPVTIRHEEVFVERHEHTGLKADLETHKREIWEVVKGLRAAVQRIETSTAETKVLREANSDLLTEVREEVTSLGKLVARLSAIVETKLEAKSK